MVVLGSMHGLSVKISNYPHKYRQTMCVLQHTVKTNKTRLHIKTIHARLNWSLSYASCVRPCQRATCHIYYPLCVCVSAFSVMSLACKNQTVTSNRDEQNRACACGCPFQSKIENTINVLLSMLLLLRLTQHNIHKAPAGGALVSTANFLPVKLIY